MPSSCGLALFLGTALAVGAQSTETQPRKASVSASQPPTGSYSDEEESVVLPEFRVETNSDNSYLATETTSGTRMAQKIIDLPYSVQSLPSEFFNDFMLFDIEDMGVFLSDVKAADSAGAGNGGATLRGFSVPYFRNGFSIIQQPDTNNIDRVEVLKGPSGSIFGATAPGGVMNIITKKPESRRSGSLEYIGGSGDYSKVSGSVTGPITKKLFYRVDATYYDFERPTYYWFNRTTDVSAGLVYKMSSNTTFNLEFNMTKRISNPYQTFTRWVDASGKTQGLVYDIPEDKYPGWAERLGRYNQAGAENRYERFNNSTYFTFQHRFGPNWSLQASLAYTDRHFRRWGPSSAGNWSFKTNTWTGSRTPYRQWYVYNQGGGQVDFAGKYKIAGLENQSHFGGDWLFLDSKYKSWQLSDTAKIQAGLPSDVSLTAWRKPDPWSDYMMTVGQPAWDASWPMVDSGTYNLYTESVGAFYNHTVTLLNKRLILMGTGRGDSYSLKRQQPLSTNANLQEADKKKNYATYSTGLSFKILDERIVAYGSYGSSFNPTPNVDKNTGEIYGNTESKGGELGLKGILFNNMFSYSAAVFNVRQDNEAVDNPNNPSGTDPSLPALVAGGSSRSRGASMDVTGRLTKSLSLMGNMSWLDSRTVENAANPSMVGNRVSNSGPARKGSFSATYAFQNNTLKGLRVGMTYYYATNYLRIAATSTADAVYIPSSSYWGGMISYKFKPTRRFTTTVHFSVTDIFSQQRITDNAFWPTGASWKLSTKIQF